jgi:multicomponent Na+:H+ antiporter subunit E
MTTFVWNLLLALIWATVLDDLSPRGLLIGFVVSYLMLGAAWRLGLGESRAGGSYFRKVFESVAFVAWFARELTVANVRMIRYTVSPLRAMSPGIVAVPLDDDLTDLEITTLANLVSLTPGTLSLDVTPDRRTLYVHAMDASDPAAVRAEVKDGFEVRIKGILR